MAGIKSVFPPLGLLAIAAMFPAEYDIRIVDMNVTSLKDEDLEWADTVFTSTMIVQRISLQNVIERCNRAGVPVVAGGPHPTTFHDETGGRKEEVIRRARERFESIPGEFRYDGDGIEHALASFCSDMNARADRRMPPRSSSEPRDVSP